METPSKLTEEQIKALCEAYERTNSEGEHHEPPREIHLGFGKDGKIVERRTETK